MSQDHRTSSRAANAKPSMENRDLNTLADRISSARAVIRRIHELFQEKHVPDREILKGINEIRDLAYAAEEIMNLAIEEAEALEFEFVRRDRRERVAPACVAPAR